MRDSPRTARTRFATLPLVVLLVACGDVQAPDQAADRATESAIAADRGGPAAAAASHQFIAHLSGDEEVPPVDTRAQGQATFRLSADGSELSYRLIVANIENVMMAHIHNAPAGVNGGVVVWLYPEDGPPPELIPGRSNGVLATGVITSGDLIGPLAGGTMEDLLEIMRGGEAYVNVHTTANPPGEIRGQIR